MLPRLHEAGEAMSNLCSRCAHGKRVRWRIGRYMCDAKGKRRFVRERLFCGGFERKVGKR